MKFKLFSTILLFFQCSSTSIYAAGGAVNEDLAPLFTLTENMIAASNKNDSEGFMSSVTQAFRITAENRNNSMVLPRVSAKLRAAKKAVKNENFSEAVVFLQDAEKEIQKKRVIRWDGGTE